jgi:hypothetical protein
MFSDYSFTFGFLNDEDVKNDYYNANTFIQPCHNNLSSLFT